MGEVNLVRPIAPGLLALVAGLACHGGDQILASSSSATTTDATGGATGTSHGAPTWTWSGTNACEQCVFEHCWPDDLDCLGASCECQECLETAWNPADCVEPCTQQPEPFELWMCIQDHCMGPCATEGGAGSPPSGG